MMMTTQSALDAVVSVLTEASEPLHYKELTRRILDSGLWTSAGKTPEATANARISTEINQRGHDSRFVRRRQASLPSTTVRMGSTR